VRQVIGRDGDRHPVTWYHLDVEASQASTDTGEERVALVALDSEMTARERLDYASLNLNEIVSCHSKPFRRVSCTRCAKEIVGTIHDDNGHAYGRKGRDPYTNATTICRYANA